MPKEFDKTFKYKGWEVDVSRTAFRGLTTWTAESDKGSLSDREGGDLPTLGVAKDFIKSQIDKFEKGEEVHRGVSDSRIGNKRRIDLGMGFKI